MRRGECIAICVSLSHGCFGRHFGLLRLSHDQCTTIGLFGFVALMSVQLPRRQFVAVTGNILSGQWTERGVQRMIECCVHHFRVVCKIEAISLAERGHVINNLSAKRKTAHNTMLKHFISCLVWCLVTCFVLYYY